MSLRQNFEYWLSFEFNLWTKISIFDVSLTQRSTTSLYSTVDTQKSILFFRSLHFLKISCLGHDATRVDLTQKRDKFSKMALLRIYVHHEVIAKRIQNLFL